MCLHCSRDEARKKELEDMRQRQEMLRAQIEGVNKVCPCFKIIMLYTF